MVEQLFAGERQANLEGNAAPLLKLLETCGMVGMPVVFHCDVDLPGARGPEAPAYLEGIRRLLADPAVAGTVIAWAHAGGLGRFVSAPAGHVQALRAMLADSRFNHVHIDLSWSVVAERLVRDSETLAQWAVLINDYPTRFLYGSDAVAPMDGERWNQTYGKYRDLLAALAPACRRQVCTGNYERVFIAARRKVPAFECYILPGIIADLGRAFMPQPAAAMPMLRMPESPEKPLQ